MPSNTMLLGHSVGNEGPTPKLTIGNEFEQRNAQANDHKPEVFALDQHHGGRHVVVMVGRRSNGESRIVTGRHGGVIHARVVHGHATVVHIHP